MNVYKSDLETAQIYYLVHSLQTLWYVFRCDQNFRCNQNFYLKDVMF